MKKPCPFSPGDEVEVRTYDWQSGDVVFKARVVRQTSDSHIKVRVDDGLFFAVPIEDCTLISSQEREAA
jgi:hypothetical protein